MTGEGLPALVPYKKRTTRKKIAIFDSETDPFENGAEIKAFTCGFYDGDSYNDFWGDDCIEQFGRFLQEKTWKGEEYLIYAHNFGGFDVHQLMQGLDRGSRPMIINGKIAKAFLWGQEFRDSYKILPVPLREFAKEEFDYKKNYRAVRKQHKKEILWYQYTDCLNLYKPVMAFHDMFGDRLTIGNTAINMLQAYHSFERLNAEQDAMIRPYFYGGRTQAFKKGIFYGDWKVFDVNSMYPFVMANFRHPVSNSIISTPYLTENTAFVTVRGWNHGAFPSRMDNGSLDFNVEYGEFKVTIHEFNTALELGLFKVDRIIECLNFEIWQTFDNYINHFYDLRLHAKDIGDKLLIIFYKLLMNNAYGKFAQDGAKYKDYEIVEHGDMPRGGIWHGEQNPKGWLPAWEHEYGVIWERPSVKPPAYYNVATGASITGASRAYLMRGIHGGTNVMYCDTDSLICEDAHIDQDARRLGAWKLEAEGTELGIAGKKLYALRDGKRVIKKASKGVGLTADQIFEVAGGAEIVYKPEVPTFRLDGSWEYTDRRVRMT